MTVARDTAYNLAAAAAPAVLLLVTTPFYLDVIGADRFGVLAICWTIVSTFRFASLGMGPALTYRLAAMDDASASARSDLAWTALLIGAAASVIGALLVVSVGDLYFRFFFHAASGLTEEVVQSLPLLGLLLSLAILIGILNGALRGARRFGTLGVIGVATSALIALAPLGTAYLISSSLEALILATVVATAIMVVWEVAICVRAVPLRMPQRPTGADLKALIGYGSWASATAFIAPFLLLLDRFVIGALRGPAAVAVYVLPYNVVQQTLLIPASLNNAMLPRLAPLADEEEARELQSSSLIWLNGLLTPLSIVAIALAAPFFQFWIGRSLGLIASPVAAILLVGAWAHGIAHVPAALVLGRRRPDLQTKWLLAFLPPYVLGLYFATLRFGVIGAASAWTIRAAFDPILFVHTNPKLTDVRSVAMSAVLVFCAMAAALIVPWTSALYWIVMAMVIFAAGYQNRAVLLSSIGEFRKLALRIA